MSSLPRHLLSLVAAALVGAPSAFAAGGIPVTVNWYGKLLHAFHIDHHWEPTVGAIASSLILLVVGLAYKASVAKASATDVPSGKFSLRFVVETLMSIPWSVARDQCGDKARKFMPLLGAIFMFILVSNLSGMVPGFEPATIFMDTNVAIGIIVFLVYNYAGIKENGWAYANHFIGPVLLIAPLFLFIELVGHAARPFSLGLRLAGNIFADHTLVGVANMAYIGAPTALMFFGLLVAVVQAFVFTLMSGIYISMATAHDH